MSQQPGFTPEIIASIRSRFINVESDPIIGKRIYFENAGGTLKLKAILPEVELLTGLPDNAGRQSGASKYITEAMAKGRKDIALMLGANSGKIISEQSGTSMIFRILSTIIRSIPGTNIVTSDLDHPAAYDACHILARRHGLECRVAHLDPATGEVRPEAVARLVDEGTVVVAIIDASNMLGTRNDVAEMVRQARRVKPELYFFIDGCQHVSHGLVDVEEYGADAWIFDAYKAYSKIGASFAHISDRLAHLDRDNLAGKPADDWDLGTREPAAFACMSKVVEYFQWLGGNFTDSDDPRAKIIAATRAIERYEAVLVDALLHGAGGQPGLLALPGVTVYGQTKDLTKQQAIIAFRMEGVAAGDIVRFLEARGVCVHTRTRDAYSRHTLEALGINECVRVSLCHYNTCEEIAVLLGLLRQVQK